MEPDGRPVDEDAALDRLAGARVLLLGETHDRAADHIWQAAVIAAVAERRGTIAVGLEMFPRRAQPALDAWVAGVIDEAAFLSDARWSEVWGFDPALYRPVFALCRQRCLPMLALNIDRPLVSEIGRGGWEAIPSADRDWFSPALAATPAYRRYLFEATGGARPDRTAQTPEDPAFDRFVRAQQAWDRAFACAIAAALAAAPERAVAALIGRGHLEYGHGTPAQLAGLGVDGVVTALPGGAADGPPIADLIFVHPGVERDQDGSRRLC